MPLIVFTQRYHIFSHPADEKHDEGLIQALGGLLPEAKDIDSMNRILLIMGKKRKRNKRQN